MTRVKHRAPVLNGMLMISSLNGLIPVAIACLGYGGFLCNGGWLYLALLTSPAFLIFQAKWIDRHGPDWGQNDRLLARLDHLPLGVSIPSFAVAILLTFAGFFAGAQLGQWGRRVYCRILCHQCRHLINAVNRFKMEQGHEPADLAEIAETYPDDPLMNVDFITMQGRILEINANDGGYSIMELREATIQVDLDRSGCYLMVLVETPLPMSFTRHYFFEWSSHHPEWRYTYAISYPGVLFE